MTNPEASLSRTPEHPRFAIPTVDDARRALLRILDHPDSYPLDRREPVGMNGMTVTVGAFGTYRSNEEIKRKAREAGLLTPILSDLIDNIGFTGGYHFSSDYSPLDPESQALMALHGSRIAQALARARRWDSIDHLYYASVSSIVETPKLMAELLERKGIRVGKTHFYGMACAGVGAALRDVCRDPNYHGKRVLIVGQETLSGRFVDPTDFQIESTFGNGIAGIALIPNVDIALLPGTDVARVQKDEFGVIRVPRLYMLPKDRVAVPDGYDVDPNAVYDFVASEDGVVMTMPELQGEYASMKGIRTFKHFAEIIVNHAVTSAINYASYYPDLAKKYGLSVALIHQASKPVILKSREKIAEALTQLRLVGQHAGRAGKFFVPEEFRHLLPEEFDLGWFMDKVRSRNVSAATILFGLKQMIEDKVIPIGRPFPMVAFGIGSVGVSGIFYLPEEGKLLTTS